MSVILFVKTFSQNICGDRWLKSLEEVDVMKTFLRSSLKTLFITKPSNSACPRHTFWTDFNSSCTIMSD